MDTKLVQLVPEYRDYVWGGQRLRPGTLTAEAWVIYEDDRIANGPLAGKTLGDAARELGAELLGENPMKRTGTRFPILIKLLDCNEWLSVQVHPNDEQAAQMAGPDQFGKTEAWYILEAQDNAQLVAGVRAGTSAEVLAQSIRNGTIADHVAYHAIHTGSTVYMPAGTLHALGPGALVYEVQETSDLTYRIYDWGRPPRAGRMLHIEQSIAVTDPLATGKVQPPVDLQSTDQQQLVQCPYFTLEILAAQTTALQLDTRGQSFHAITLIEGQGAIECDDQRVELQPLETVLVAASARSYQLRPIGPRGLRALKSSVE
jgi:mannose-6-phosphate isomerase